MDYHNVNPTRWFAIVEMTGGRKALAALDSREIILNRRRLMMCWFSVKWSAGALR
jgi:hypothetical protein